MASASDQGMRLVLQACLDASYDDLAALNDPVTGALESKGLLSGLGHWQRPTGRSESAGAELWRRWLDKVYDMATSQDLRVAAAGLRFVRAHIRQMGPRDLRQRASAWALALAGPLANKKTSHDATQPRVATLREAALAELLSRARIWPQVLRSIIRDVAPRLVPRLCGVILDGGVCGSRVAILTQTVTSLASSAKPWASPIKAAGVAALMRSQPGTRAACDAEMLVVATARAVSGEAGVANLVDMSVRAARSALELLSRSDRKRMDAESTSSADSSAIFRPLKVQQRGSLADADAIASRFDRACSLAVCAAGATSARVALASIIELLRDALSAPPPPSPYSALAAAAVTPRIRSTSFSTLASLATTARHHMLPYFARLSRALMNALGDTDPRAQWRLRCEGYGAASACVRALGASASAIVPVLVRTAVADIRRLTELLAKTSIRTASAGANSSNEASTKTSRSGKRRRLHKQQRIEAQLLAGTGGASHGASDPTAAGSWRVATCAAGALEAVFLSHAGAFMSLGSRADTDLTLITTYSAVSPRRVFGRRNTRLFMAIPGDGTGLSAVPRRLLAQVRTELVNALIASCACPLASGAPDLRSPVLAMTARLCQEGRGDRDSDVASACARGATMCRALMGPLGTRAAAPAPSAALMARFANAYAAVGAEADAVVQSRTLSQDTPVEEPEPVDETDEKTNHKSVVDNAALQSNAPTRPPSSPAFESFIERYKADQVRAETRLGRIVAKMDALRSVVERGAAEAALGTRITSRTSTTPPANPRPEAVDATKQAVSTAVEVSEDSAVRAGGGAEGVDFSTSAGAVEGAAAPDDQDGEDTQPAVAMDADAGPDPGDTGRLWNF